MIVTVAVPTVALAEAVSVRVEVTLPFAGGVTGLVENAAVTPLGRPDALSVVAGIEAARAGDGDRAGSAAALSDGH